MKNRTETKESLLERYNCGPVKLSGDSNAFYERHVMFDQVIAETETTKRDKFEAVARSVRDVLSQRWLKTEQTYRQRNAKRVYYLSMEFRARSRAGQQHLQSSA
jgi:starch phosphorylase